MSALMSVMILLVVVLGLAVVALSYRLWKLRQGGTAAIMRDLPSVAGHGWRHGVIPYRGADAAFFRLSSVRLWPDRQLNRRGVEVVSRRPPRGDEFDIMTEEIIVLELRDTMQDRNAGYEIALDKGALTAFQSWLECRQCAFVQSDFVARVAVLHGVAQFQHDDLFGHYVELVAARWASRDHLDAAPVELPVGPQP